MLSVKEKLQFLDGSIKVDLAENDKNTFKDARIDLSELEQIDASLITSEGSSYILREKIYDLNFKHGGFLLKKLSSITPKDFKYLAADPSLQDYFPKDYLFFDTETTGLAGGTGTYIFLFGLGFLKDNQFVIQQYLVPDLDSEAVVLLKILKIFKQFRGIVSYNGKSYDVPLLKTRLLLNRYNADDIEEKQHIDLLHCSRRLWKRFTRCDLQSIERGILGFARQNDVPGRDIPALYFNFLKNKDIAPLKSVLKHNVIDILSMLSIILHTVSIIKNFDKHKVSKKYDPHSLFKLFNRLGETDRALFLAENNKRETNIQLSFEQGKLLKRLGDYTKAQKVWRRLIAENRIYEEAYLELAKYFEHHERNYQKAINIVDSIIKRIEISTELFPEKATQFTENWQYRKNRLVRKAKNAKFC